MTKEELETENSEVRESRKTIDWFVQYCNWIWERRISQENYWRIQTIYKGDRKMTEGEKYEFYDIYGKW